MVFQRVLTASKQLASHETMTLILTKPYAISDGSYCELCALNVSNQFARSQGFLNVPPLQIFGHIFYQYQTVEKSLNMAFLHKLCCKFATPKLLFFSHCIERQSKCCFHVNEHMQLIISAFNIILLLTNCEVYTLKCSDCNFEVRTEQSEVHMKN